MNHYIEFFSLDQFLSCPLLKSIEVFQYSAHRTIVLEQSEINYLYLLVDGQLRCAHYQYNGRLAVFNLMNPLSAIGDVEMFSEEKTSTAVITTLPSVLLGIPRTVVERDGVADPNFMRFFVGGLRSKIYNSASLHLGHLLPVKARFAFYVLMLPGAQNGKVVILPDKETLASMLGATVRHLNRVIRDLIDDGAIGEGYPGVGIKNQAILHRLIE